MAYTSGEASNIYDLLEAIDTLVTGTVGWNLIVKNTSKFHGVDRTSYCIWMAKGDGNDNIYMQIRIPDGSGNSDGNGNIMLLDSLAGYDKNLFYFEQPGSIQQWLQSEGKVEVSQPAFTTTADERFYYWIFANQYRIIVITRMSIVYESMYMGFINPISSERQYPYPVYVAGNSIATGNTWPDNITGSFVFPTNGSGYLRRADGTWRSFEAPAQYPSWNSVGTIFPYNTGNKKLVPNYIKNNSQEQDNLLMMPVMLQTTNPIDVNGILREVYWNSGTRDVAAEQILTYNSQSYIIFDTKDLRGSNTYFAVKLE